MSGRPRWRIRSACGATCTQRKEAASSHHNYGGKPAMHGDNAHATDYDDPMCARLLGTAADVLRSFGSAFAGRHLAIVGGAVPSLLVGGPPKRHAPACRDR